MEFTVWVFKHVRTLFVGLGCIFFFKPIGKVGPLGLLKVENGVMCVYPMLTCQPHVSLPK